MGIRGVKGGAALTVVLSMIFLGGGRSGDRLEEVLSQLLEGSELRSGDLLLL